MLYRCFIYILRDLVHDAQVVFNAKEIANDDKIEPIEETKDLDGIRIMYDCKDIFETDQQRYNQGLCELTFKTPLLYYSIPYIRT